MRYYVLAVAVVLFGFAFAAVASPAFAMGYTPIFAEADHGWIDNRESTGSAKAVMENILKATTRTNELATLGALAYTPWIITDLDDIANGGNKGVTAFGPCGEPRVSYM